LIAALAPAAGVTAIEIVVGAVSLATLFLARASESVSACAAKPDGAGAAATDAGSGRRAAPR
jgi:hypothetical protein